MRQRTVDGPTPAFRGVGLHSGRRISMRILPAAAGAGIAFVRRDLGGARIAARAANVRDTLLATTLADGDGKVGTVEHLMSALCACGVDNATVELDGPEVPIMDGSARPFVTILHDHGLAEQDAPKQVLRVRRTVTVDMGDGRQASYAPHPQATWELEIDFPQPVVRRTPCRRHFTLTSNASYVADISRARTFGFVEDLDLMRAHQRALGGSMGNAIVLRPGQVLNADGLRQHDEFVAHKLLDAIGDCYIEGRMIVGRYRATRPGHELNNLLVRELLAREGNWEAADAGTMLPPPDFGPLRAPPL